MCCIWHTHGRTQVGWSAGAASGLQGSGMSASRFPGELLGDVAAPPGTQPLTPLAVSGRPGRCYPGVVTACPPRRSRMAAVSSAETPCRCGWISRVSSGAEALSAAAPGGGERPTPAWGEQYATGRVWVGPAAPDEHPTAEGPRARDDTATRIPGTQNELATAATTGQANCTRLRHRAAGRCGTGCSTSRAG
jgi:hypothetical protein